MAGNEANLNPDQGGGTGNKTMSNPKGGMSPFKLISGDITQGWGNTFAAGYSQWRKHKSGREFVSRKQMCYTWRINRKSLHFGR